METNIIIFELNEDNGSAALVEKLKKENILGYAITPNRLRLVLHLDITEEMVSKTIDVIRKL